MSDDSVHTVALHVRFNEQEEIKTHETYKIRVSIIRQSKLDAGTIAKNCH